jgi:hypothetical protein
VSAHVTCSESRFITMSRTDKDRPYWVRVNDKRDKQRRGVEHRHTGWRGSVRDCDEHVLCSGHDYRTTNCTPYLDYHIYATSPQRSACATEWHRQERAGQRVIKRNLTVPKPLVKTSQVTSSV